MSITWTLVLILVGLAIAVLAEVDVHHSRRRHTPPPGDIQ